MKLWRTSFILLALMVATSVMAVVMRPTEKLAEQGPKINLESMVPTVIGDWQEEKAVAVQIVDPQRQELIDKLYNQTLSRTYVNGEGYRIMLSIAYGSNQSDSMQMHLPEVCYPAQGFTLEEKKTGSLAIGQGSIPVTRIMTVMGPRSEPVTYWTTIGEQVVQGGLSKKLAEMSYGLTGKIPDGMLIRVSSIDPNEAKAYEIQNRFAAQMIESLTPEYRKKMTGIVQLN